MNQLNEPVFTETNKERIDAILYQAMFDETIRLRKCRNRKEREKIRAFIMEAYQLFAERNLENENQDIFQGCMQPQNLHTNTSVAMGTGLF